MKLKFNFKFNKLSGSSLPKVKLSVVLWVVIGIVAVLSGLVIFKEVRKVTSVQTDNSAIFDRIVRVNLNQFKDLENKLGENSSFQPVIIPGANAFSTPPAAAQSTE
ncbi:MAG TPA: hypothetical protein VHQ41_03850 [Patescibacteria group bacterium]|jgi:hypothetical protein|nr:hypothetical protein [Patescibacteria group bacterium]